MAAKKKAASTRTYGRPVGKQGAMAFTTTTRRPKSGTKTYTKVSKPYTPGSKRLGAEGPKRSIAGGYGSVTRAVPGGGRKKVGPNKSKAALKTLGNEGRGKKKR